MQLPYHIVQTDDLAYKFITQSGVVYAAYFIDISEAFGADHVYTFSFDAEFVNTKMLKTSLRSAEMCLIMAESYAHSGDTENANAMFDKIVGEHGDSEYAQKASTARGY